MMKIWKILIISFLLLGLLVEKTRATSQIIDATVGLSVCGNGAKEGGEECDNSDLNGATCSSLGYSTGNLGCYSYCEFNESACSGVATTPTPTATPTPESGSSSSNSQGSTSVSTALQNIVQAIVTTESVGQRSIPVSIGLPVGVSVFDIDGDNVLGIYEMREVVTAWVVGFKEVFGSSSGKTISFGGGQMKGAKCDINEDDDCDLRDFSILLYYFN